MELLSLSNIDRSNIDYLPFTEYIYKGVDPRIMGAMCFGKKEGEMKNLYDS